MITCLWKFQKGSEVVWFFKGDPVCVHCGKETLIGFFLSSWSKKSVVNEFVCDGCARIRRNLYTQSFSLVHATVDVPPGSVPVVPQHPGLTNSSNMDVFEVATKNLGGESVVDRTRLSGRTHQALQEPKVKTLLETTSDVDGILDFHLTADKKASGQVLLEVDDVEA